jgi:hypothetical protein
MKAEAKQSEIQCVKWDGKTFSEEPEWLIDCLNRKIPSKGTIKNAPTEGELYIKNDDHFSAVLPGDYILMTNEKEIFCMPERIFDLIYKVNP